MRLELKRWLINKTSTIGKLSINGKFFCYTLEDRIRPPGEKVQDETAIPFGTYKIKMTYAPHFKQTLPWLQDVPMFTGILMHAGNTIKDTKGCILVGQSYEGETLKESRVALTRLLTAMEGQDEIEITVS